MAAFNMVFSVALPTGISAVNLPSDNTSILSDIASISGSSEETTIIPIPASANCKIIL